MEEYEQNCYEINDFLTTWGRIGVVVKTMQPYLSKTFEIFRKEH